MMVYVYPNIPRHLMGGGNPYVENLKRSLGVDPQTAPNAFRDLLRKGFRADVLVLNWVEDLPLRKSGTVQALVFLLALPVLKLRGQQIVWIKHNKDNHSGKKSWLGARIRKALTRYATLIVVHSTDCDLPAALPNLRFVPHPSHLRAEDIAGPAAADIADIAAADIAGPAAADIADIAAADIADIAAADIAEAAADIAGAAADNAAPRPEADPPPIDLLIWGSLLPYKGVLEFLRFADQDPYLRTLRIHIQGKCAPGYREALEPYVKGNIKLVDDYIAEDALEGLFRQTKCILFTYRKTSVLSSGVLIDSLRAGKRILGPDCGAFRDLATYDFVSLYKELKDLPELFRRYEYDYQLNQDSVRAFVTDHSWDNFGARLKTMLTADPDLLKNVNTCPESPYSSSG
ncbi:glycosyltransferase [Dinghuibacter silviterrae]|uniref:Glycosyltransferase involved in cell wall biosynthesis n=1 Tax=Dinghuibacter silviterrae TaxID=1539049 RepID=A0A4R8DX30_9BACT|nr:glycosyltransferase [Dinghuibacter silviterrae]TDX01771.1 hypothetical protein EDB95_2814 [Dinghuibacter silviterrae]